MNPRRAFVGWFTLVALYTVVTRSDRVAGLLGLTSAGLRRISDPSVPLIPDVAGSSSSKATTPTWGSTTDIYGTNGGSYVGSTFVPNPAPTDPRGGPKDKK